MVFFQTNKSADSFKKSHCTWRLDLKFLLNTSAIILTLSYYNRGLLWFIQSHGRGFWRNRSSGFCRCSAITQTPENLIGHSGDSGGAEWFCFLYIIEGKSGSQHGLDAKHGVE